MKHRIRRRWLTNLFARLGLGNLALLAAGIPIIAGGEDPPEKKFTQAELDQAVQDAVGDKKFTQADMDRVVQDRLARQKAQFADYDDLKTKATELEQLKAAGKTELERAQEAQAAAEQAKAEAEQKATEATTKANDTLLRAQIVTAAAKAGAHSPDAVYALMKDASFKASGEEGKELQVTIGDDGQVTGHEETVTAFLAADANKYLVGEPPQPGPVGGGPRPTPQGALTPEALSQMTPQQIAALKDEDLDKAMAAS